MGLLDTYDSVSGSGDYDKNLGVIDFARIWCLFNPTLAQKCILKMYAGEELNTQVEVPHTISEQEWLDRMYEDNHFPQNLHERRKVVGQNGFQQIVLVVGRRGGKMETLDTPLPTPTGWTTMGDVKEGDYVLDEKGKPTRVNFVTPTQYKECYEVTFSDGTKTIAGEEHLWTTLDHNARKSINRYGEDIPEDWANWEGRGKQKKGPKVADSEEKECSFGGCQFEIIAKGFCSGHYQQKYRSKSGILKPLEFGKNTAKTMTTKEMKETLTYGKRGDTNHAIPTTLPLDLPEKDLPVDPYVLGVWLGDGTATNGNLTFSDEDQEVADNIINLGYEVNRKKYGDKCPTWTVSGLREGLKQIHVLNNKHIPVEYLRASFEQRLSLLQGLMDSDGGGSKEDNEVEFSNTNKEIIDGFYELAVSLGFVVRVRETEAKLYGRVVGKNWKVTFTPNREIQVFKLSRKNDLYSSDKSCSNGRVLRYVTSIEPVGKREARCISVDNPTSLYLTGKSMIPTHNTSLIAVAALYSIYKLLMKDNPQAYYNMVEGDTISVAVAATSQDQTEKTSFGKILRICQDAIANNTPLAKWIDTDGLRAQTIYFKTVNDSRKEREIRKNKSIKNQRIASVQMEAYNSSADSHRGNAVIAAILDEFAQFGITKEGRDAASYFHQTLVASFAQFGKDSRLFILSTPQGEIGKFYEIYRDAWDGTSRYTLAVHMPTWVAWQYEENPNVRMEDIADSDFYDFNWDYENGEAFEVAWMRAPSHIRREFGAEFEGAEAQWLPSILIRENFMREELFERFKGIIGRSYVAHADPARTGDGFAFVIVHKELINDGTPYGKEVIFVDHAFRWYVAPHNKYESYGDKYEEVIYQEGDKPAFIHTSKPMRHIKKKLNDFNIQYLSFDHFQQTGYVDELVDYCMERDIDTQIDTIHFTRPYNFERSKMVETLLLEDRLRTYEHPILKWEFLNLQKDRVGRVSKSLYSTDDLYDALSTAALNAIDMPEGQGGSVQGGGLDIDPAMPRISL